MYEVNAYHANGEFAFVVFYDTEDEAIAYVKGFGSSQYDFEIECPDGEIIYA